MTTGDEPLFAWDNTLWRSGATLTASDGDASVLTDPATSTRWAPTDAAPTLDVSGYGEGRLTCMAIAAHNLGSLGGSLDLQKSDGAGGWTTIQTLTPADDTTALLTFDLTFLSSFRLTVPQGAEVGVIYVGDALRPARRIYGGHEPAVYHPDYKLAVTNSGAHYLGQIQRRAMLDARVKVSNVAARWVRDDLPEFRTHFDNGLPFFFGWRPTTYADETVYAWRAGGPMDLSNTGPRDLMQMTLSLQAYDGAA